MRKYTNVIAIDGPSGSGKSSMAQNLARRLNVMYVDTGSMFRAIGYFLDREGIAPTQALDIEKALSNILFSYQDNPEQLVTINEENLSELIRLHRVSELASIYSQVPAVRAFLLNFQRQLPNNYICLLEGRDIGTVVFPEAFCKIFVTASAEVRAQRRHEQLRNLGQLISLEKILSDVKARDLADTTRAIAPLKQAEDAYLVDTSEINQQQAEDKIIEIIKARAQELDIQL